MDKLTTIVLVFGCMVLFVCGLSLLMAWPFMWLWNYAAVAALSVAKPITYWPAFCLMVLVGTFFAKRNSTSSD